MFRRTGDPLFQDAWLCGLSGRGRTLDGCSPTWEHCPRVELSRSLCPDCFAEGHVVRVLHDPETGRHLCLACESHWTSRQALDLDWANLQIEAHQIGTQA